MKVPLKLVLKTPYINGFSALFIKNMNVITLNRIPGMPVEGRIVVSQNVEIRSFRRIKEKL